MKIDYDFLNYNYNRSKTALTIIIGFILAFAVAMLAYACVDFNFSGEEGLKNAFKLASIILLATSSCVTFGINWYLLKVGPLNRKRLFYFNIIFYEISLYLASLIVGIEYAMSVRVPLFFYVVTFTLPILFILKPHRFAALSIFGTIVFLVIAFVCSYKDGTLNSDNLHQFAIQVVSAGIVNVIIIYKMYEANQNAFKYQQKLSKESHVDYLTGLNNRRALDQMIESLNGDDMYLIILDVDNFKRINDEYGHDIGDECLIIVSRKIVKYFGKNNVFRFGGDEIVIVSDKSFEQIRDELKTISESVKEKYPFSGISSGVYKLDGDDAKDALIKADKALYAAKFSEKGTSVLYTEK